MDPSLIPKTDIRLSVNRILNRAANLRAKLQDSHSDLRQTIQSLGSENAVSREFTPGAGEIGDAVARASYQQHSLPPLQRPSSEYSGYALQDRCPSVVSAQTKHQNASRRVVEVSTRPETKVVLRPSKDQTFYLLVYFENIIMAKHLETLSPTKELDSLSFVTKCPPNVSVQLSEYKTSVVLPLEKAADLELSVEGEATLGAERLTFILGSASLPIRSDVLPQITCVSSSGQAARRFSRKKINCVYQASVPIRAMTVDANYTGSSSAIAGSLVIGMVDVRVLCGGAGILEFDQKIASTRHTYMQGLMYTSKCEMLEAGAQCSIEGDQSLIARTVFDQNGIPSLPPGHSCCSRIGSSFRNPSDVTTAPQASLTDKDTPANKVASVDVVIRTSKLYLKFPDSGTAAARKFTRAYSMITLQPSPELAALTGYSMTRGFILDPSTKLPATSIAADVSPYNEILSTKEILFGIDVPLTVSRRLPLVQNNIAYLQYGKVCIACFGVGTQSSKKTFLGAVDLSLSECFASNIRVGGWFALRDCICDGYLYIDAFLQSGSTRQGKFNYSLPEAPPPPTHMPPAFLPNDITSSACLSAEDTGTRATCSEERMKQRDLLVSAPTRSSVPLLSENNNFYEEVARLTNVATILGGAFQ